MTVEFKAVEAIDSLVALLRVAEDAAVHCWEQDEPFPPGIFPGLILLARFAADRAGEEFKQAVVAAEVSRWNKNLQGERDELQQKILQVAAERDAACEQHLVECRKCNAEVERRLALETQLAQVTAERDGLKRQWDDLEKSFVQSMQPTMTSVVQLVEAAEATAVEVIKKPAELPPETEPPEPYQWQVGDEIRTTRYISPIEELCDGKFRLEGTVCFVSQVDAHRWGWKLHRKAIELPDIPRFTEQQMADFAAAVEEIDDDDEQEEEIVTLAEWSIVTSEPEGSEWTPGRWDDESDGIGQVTMFRTGSTTERYVHNARIPVRDLRAAGINLGQWLRFREVLVCGESGRQEYRFEIRQCDQPISDSVGTNGEGQS
jgi:hypothetical protein